MSKNIFIKSMLRQPVRSFLLVLLIATASFAFVLRAVEYIVIRNQISAMTGFFQGIGVLSHRQGVAVDVSQAIEIVAESPYVSFYDIRRGFEGTLDGMFNAYIDGSRYWRANWFYNYMDWYSASAYIDLMPRLGYKPDFAGFVSGDSFFYGEVIDIRHVYESPWVWEQGFEPHKLIYVQVDDVLHGYPERIAEGQTVRLRKNFPYEWDSPLTGIETSQRYFFKATFYFMLDFMQFEYGTITMLIKPIGEGGLWYIQVGYGETIDTVYYRICRQLEFARHAQSAVYLRTTRDMAMIPNAQMGQGILSLRYGRLIGFDDYVNARHVVAVCRTFSEIRQKGIGDILTITVNADQHLVYSPYYILGYDDYIQPRLMTIFPELGILSIPGSDPAITLELEIVGIYDFFRWRPINTNWSSKNKFMFIPDSLLPVGWGLQSAYFGDITPGYIPALWFSFILYCPRDQARFIWSTRDALSELGFRVGFVGRESGGFLATADTILTSVMLNLVIFSFVMALVLVFMVALFMWQRKKDYAILRALGCSAKNIYMQSVIALTFFGLPAVMAGSIAGWFYAIRLTEPTILGFREIMLEAMGGHLLMTSERIALIDTHMAMAAQPLSQLVIFGSIIYAAMVALITLNNMRAASKSALEILGGA